MIRAFESSDMNDVLNIWLKASIAAHGFVEEEFWESRIDDMREKYLPNSDTYVFSENGSIQGFFSLQGDWLAAMFVSPDAQRQGIGRGSRVRVVLNDVKAVFHRPHPERITEKCAIKSVRRFLKEAGVIS
ncbi:MAG: hypothetical protein R6U13_10180 [Desulfatiglandaceae bacterium]